MRRLLPPALSLFMALGLVALPAPRTARADPLPTHPTMDVTPYCFDGGGLQTVTIKGWNFEPNSSLVVAQFGHYEETDAVAYVNTDAYGVFTATLNLNIDPYYPNIRLDALTSLTADPFAYAYVSGCYAPDTQLLPVNKCVDPENPSIEVRGTGFGASGVGGDIRLQLSRNEQDIGEPLIIPAATRFRATLKPGVTLALGEYQISATQSALSGEFFWNQYTTVYVPCPQATIEPICVPSSGSPPDRLSLMVSGIGWQKGTADGYDELDIVFDPQGEPQQFSFSANPYEGEPGISALDGSVGPLEINPFARPDGVYTVEVKQQGYDEEPLLSVLLTFTVPCAAPTLTADPSCGPPALVGDTEKQRYSIAVTGAGFYPNEDIVVVFDPDYAAGSDYPPESFDSVVNEDGTFSMSIDAAYRPPGAYRIYAYEQTRFGLFQASLPFPVPCIPPAPTLVIDPTCGSVATTLPLAYTVNMTGGGFAPGRVDIVFDPTGLLPEQATATADAKGSFSTFVQFNGRSPGAYLIVASQTSIFGVLDEVSVPFPVTCEGAILRITPKIGARGFVPTVEGFNFPGSTTLYLLWDYGIGSTQPMKVQTDELGSFRRQVVIFRSDFTGLRHLTVQLPDDPLAYADMLPLDYLVTPTTVSPPFKILDNPFAGPDATIVLRR